MTLGVPSRSRLQFYCRETLVKIATNQPTLPLLRVTQGHSAFASGGVWPTIPFPEYTSRYTNAQVKVYDHHRKTSNERFKGAEYNNVVVLGHLQNVCAVGMTMVVTQERGLWTTFLSPSLPQQPLGHPSVASEQDPHSLFSASVSIGLWKQPSLVLVQVRNPT